MAAQDQPQGTAPARKSALDVEDDYSKFEVTSRTEILSILRSLIADGAMVTCYFNHGYDFLLTSIIEVSADGKSVILDYGSNMDMNRKMLQTDKINCSSMKDKVKIQFQLDGVDGVKHGGSDAFNGDVPKSLVRLQRREYYRLETPKGNPLLCDIPVPQADGSLKPLRAVVVDISGGGIGLNLPPGEAAITSGAEFSGASTNLAGGGVISFAMRVKNIYDITMANGKTQQRAGCQFVNLPGPAMTQIQRYVIQIERERKTREV